MVGRVSILLYRWFGVRLPKRANKWQPGLNRKPLSPTRTYDDNAKFFSHVSQSSDTLSIGSTPTSCVDCRKRKKKRREETDVVTSVSYVVASFSSGSKSIFSSEPKHAL